MTQFELVFYPDKQSDFAELDKKVRSWIAEHAKEYVIAKHEAFKGGDGMKPNDLHWHYYIKMSTSWGVADLVKSIGLDREEQIQKIKKQWKTAILYARHINQKEKPLIDASCIETNISDYEALCGNALDRGYPDVQRSRALPSEIDDYANNLMTRKELIKAIGWNGYNLFKKEIDNAQRFRSENVLTGVNRKMRVIYITGASSTGKTTLAKFMASKLGYDAFVSGSGKDPLDGYDNERCIILDELRGDVFQKSEIFKLLDNNTASRVKSRYFNKVVSSCALMIITSIYAPDELYQWQDGKSEEPFKQFARRLGYGYILIDDVGQTWNCFYDKDNPKPKRIKVEEAPLNMRDVFTILGIEEKLPDPINELMFEVSACVREDLEKMNASK